MAVAAAREAAALFGMTTFDQGFTMPMYRGLIPLPMMPTSRPLTHRLKARSLTG